MARSLIAFLTEYKIYAQGSFRAASVGFYWIKVSSMKLVILFFPPLSFLYVTIKSNRIGQQQISKAVIRLTASSIIVTLQKLVKFYMTRKSFIVFGIQMANGKMSSKNEFTASLKAMKILI